MIPARRQYMCYLRTPRIRTVIVSLGLVSMLGAPLWTQAQRVATDVTNARRPSSVLDRTITIDVSKVTLEAALDALAAAANVRIGYDVRIIDPIHSVSVHVKDTPLRIALERLLHGTGLRAEMLTPEIISIKRGTSPASIVDGSITGRVLDANTKQPLRGVTVLLDGASKGILTESNGAFQYTTVATGTHTISARLLGYSKTTKTVTVVENQTLSIELTLTPAVNALDQIVVTGTVVATAQREVPNAMTVITAKDLEQRGITRIDQLFRGDVPGLFALNQGSNNPLDQVIMFSRGATAQSSMSEGTGGWNTNPIKTYVDGVELADPRYLSQIDPKSIERIEILTGPQASTIYGSNAINGVMQIFTKRGTTTVSQRPQVTVTLLSGWVENNFRPTRTPQHDDAAQVNGVEGHWMYNVGGSWNYLGPWTPSKQTARLSGFGGARLQYGRITADGSLRLANTRTQQGGDVQQTVTAFREQGWYAPAFSAGTRSPRTQTLKGQTLGLTLGFMPVPWWSHEVVLGADRSTTEAQAVAQGFGLPSDTLLTLTQTTADRQSLRYASTVQVPLARIARAVVTVGADAWKSLSTSLNVSALALTGTLTPSAAPRVTRQPGHNAGGFLQAQMGFGNQLFVTYGLRAEWNPNYGEDAQPNWAPRYGASYIQDFETPFGSVTAKLRGSYGRSTRPPSVGAQAGKSVRDYQGVAFANTNFIPYYGDFDVIRANPELGPEYQQGGEGGLELYLDRRGSLVVTRYNQKVDGLIAQPIVDSVRSLDPNMQPNFRRSCDADGYCYTEQFQTLNVGSIRNQGWELQGTVNVGPFTTRGTYSWTKSRVLGVDPRYRAFFTPQSYPQYQPGASFTYLPEHTWSGGITYAQGSSMVTLNISGTGKIQNSAVTQFYKNIDSRIRLTMDRARVTPGSPWRQTMGYALADLNASRRISSRIEGLLQVQNLGDVYRNDVSALWATLGRQTKLGLRLRL